LNKIAINKKIDNYIEIRKNLWTSFIALTAGIATLLLSVDSIIKIILIVVGSLGEIILIHSITSTNQRLDNLITELEDKE
jgi:heme O synthase-like polyprenyltransferase